MGKIRMHLAAGCEPVNKVKNSLYYTVLNDSDYELLIGMDLEAVTTSSQVQLCIFRDRNIMENLSC
jgi:hypothetical protein